MTKVFDFIFDFGSPNAYLAYKALDPILSRTGAKVNYIPCLLGGIFKATNNQPPMMAYNSVKGKLDYERLEMNRFINKHNLTHFRFNHHFPVNTLILMRAAIAAQTDNRLDEYINTGLIAMWEENKKMDDPQIFIQTMNEAGFDGANLLARTQDPVIKTQLMDNTTAAVDRGVFGIPTFFVGHEMFFGKDRLLQLEDTLAKM